MNEPIPKTFEEQLKIFTDRGVIATADSIDKLKHINYYRLKEFARPLSKITKNNDGTIVLNYPNVTFDEILSRYYQDKNLRINLLHAIEKIEISLKTKISYILGEQYGAFGYLNFKLWSNRKKRTLFEIEQQQFRIKTNILKMIDKSQISELKNKHNLDEDGFPSVWLAIDLLSFGDLVKIIEFMSEKNLKKLASVYNCSKDELFSWVKCLNFVRNICAHNANLIDIKLTTKPKIKKSWSNYIYYIKNDLGQTVKPTNRLSLVILIVIHLVKCINPKYNFYAIRKSLNTLIKNDLDRANLIGFKYIDSSKNIF